VIEIRSYRRVFALERRIYRVDRLRLNPAGVPVLGIVYFLILLAASLIAGSLPLVEGIAQVVPWYLRDLALPGASAAVLAVIRIEGRPFHLAAQALVRYRCTPRRTAGACRRATVGQRWLPGELLLLPDGSDARIRRLRYTGPGAVLVAVEHQRTGAAIERGSTGLARRGRRSRLVVRARAGAQALDGAQVIWMQRGVQLLAQGATDSVRRTLRW
jgi:hypothetical protein